MKSISAWSAVAVCAAALVSAAPQAQASILTYSLMLSGTQSVPANSSTAFGTAAVTVDDVLDTVAVYLSFSGLAAPATAGHIHCCVARTANGPVVIPFTGFPNSTSGIYSNTFTGVSVANINGIKAGLAYINIHNAAFTGGEIRADILPEPSSLSLVGLAALLSIGALRRRATR